MPYIVPNKRELFDKLLEEAGNISTAGELNYVITRIADIYLCNLGLTYTNINEVIGVFECAKLEFYRRIASPYEELKMEENTDVYSESNLTHRSS